MALSSACDEKTVTSITQLVLVCVIMFVVMSDCMVSVEAFGVQQSSIPSEAGKQLLARRTSSKLFHSIAKSEQMFLEAQVMLSFHVYL
jgi:hypothetical protein